MEDLETQSKWKDHFDIIVEGMITYLCHKVTLSLKLSLLTFFSLLDTEPEVRELYPLFTGSNATMFTNLKKQFELDPHRY